MIDSGSNLEIRGEINRSEEIPGVLCLHRWQENG